MSRTAIRHGRLFLVGGGAAALIVGAAALRADLMVTHSFSEMSGSAAVATSFQPAAHAGSSHAARVGDEGYWLTRADVESPVAFAKHLAIGDRITIAGQDGRQRVLEVVDLRALGEPLAKAVAGANPTRLLLVTCRVVDAGKNEASAPVRFIVEGEMSDTSPVVQSPASAKAL